MAAGRLSRPGWKVLGGIAAAALLFYAVPRVFGGMEFFRLRKVEIRGAHYLRAEEIAEKLPVRQGQSLFANLAPIQAAAESIPGLARVVVGRRLPGTLLVTVRERDPIALVMRGGKLRLLGRDGVLLPFDPTVSVPDLPLVREPDSLVTGLLARVQETDPTFFGRLISGWRSGPDVVLAVDGQRYWFRPNAPAEVIRAVIVVEQDLEKKGRRWAELDGRFAGQVVVRWEGA